MASIGVAAIGILFVFTLGLALDRWCFGQQPRSVDDEWVSVLSLGFVGLAAGALLLGYAHLLYRQVFWIAAAASVVGLVLLRHRTLALARRSARGVVAIVRQAPVLCFAALVTYALSIDLSMRAPMGTDERDYKWNTPLEFALHHQIVRVPARLSNGIYLSELVVVPAAVFRSLHGARLLQYVAVVLLAFSARAVARRLGGSGLVAGFAALGCLLVGTGAASVGSDVLAAALLCAALALLLGAGSRPRALLVSGVVLAGAVMTKQYLALTVPMFLVIALVTDVQPDGVRLRDRAEIRAMFARMFGYVVVPAAAIFLLGLLHTFVLVGSPVDKYGAGVFPASDPRVATGRAAGRIPSVRDVLLLPIVPAFVGVGGGEPYGRRAGVVLPISLAVVAFGAVLADATWRRRILLAAAIAGISYLLVAPVFIKTRFLIFSWVLVFVAADIAVASAAALASRRSARMVNIAAQLVLLLGFLDSTRWLLERYWWWQIR
ncbi:MAG: hypothetical protein ACXVKA_00970 [Acidimicrobiia bacterium]